MTVSIARLLPGVAWITLVCVVGLFTEAASLFHWVLLVSIAVIPPVLARTLSRAAVRTLLPYAREIGR